MSVAAARPAVYPSDVEARVAAVSGCLAERVAAFGVDGPGGARLVVALEADDAHPAAALTWNPALKPDFSIYPAIHAYQARRMTRPAVQKAAAEEFALFQPA